MLSKLVCTLWAASALAERAEIIIVPRLTQEQAERKKQSREGFFEVRTEMRNLSAERLRELEEVAGRKLVMIDPTKRMGSRGSKLLTENEDLSREEIHRLEKTLNALPWVDIAYVGAYNPNPPQMHPPSSDFLLAGWSSLPQKEKPEDKKFELR